MKPAKSARERTGTSLEQPFPSRASYLELPGIEVKDQDEKQDSFLRFNAEEHAKFLLKHYRKIIGDLVDELLEGYDSDIRQKVLALCLHNGTDPVSREPIQPPNIRKLGKYFQFLKEQS